MPEPNLDWFAFAALVRAYARACHGFEVKEIILRGTNGERIQLLVPPADRLPPLESVTRSGAPEPGAPEPGAGRPEDLGDSGASPPTHSADFRVVRWGTERWTLTPKQARVVARLWQAWRDGTHDVGQVELLQAADSDGVRLVDLFRGSSAWQTLICSGGRGIYRLCFAAGQPEPAESGEDEDPPEGAG